MVEDNRAILIVPPENKHLVFDPKYRHIFGDLSTGVYFPIGDENNNWVYRLPPEVAKLIYEESAKNSVRLLITGI